METVDVLVRRHSLHHRGLVDVVGERQLDEDPVDGRIRVPFVEDCQDLGLRRLGRKAGFLRGDAGLGTRLLLHADVYLRRRVLPDEHYRETWNDTCLPQASGFFLYLRPHRLSDRFTIYELRRHHCLLVYRAKFTARVSRTTTTLICPGY